MRFIFEDCTEIETTNGIISIETTLTQEIQTMIKSKFCIKPIMVKQIDKDTLLIKILSFNFQNITSELEQAIHMFNIENYRNIIFDIRDNPGGSIVEACNMIEYIVLEIIEYPYMIRDTSYNEEKRIIIGKK